MTKTTMTAKQQSSEIGLAARFFYSLYGDEFPGHITLWTLRDRQTYFFKGAWKAAEMTEELSRKHDVYYGIGLRREALPLGKRGDYKDVAAIPGFWMDLDIQGENHKSTALPGSDSEVMDFLYSLPWLPSVVVSTGGGMHVYYLFKELWIFETDEERNKAQELSRRFQAYVIAKAEQRGWKLDNTSDLARVLRVPGTWNRKHAPAAIKIITDSPDRRYSPSDFEDYVQEETASKSKLEPGIILSGTDEGNRDNTLHSYACSLQARGMPYAEAKILMREAARNCRPEFDASEALKKLERVYVKFEGGTDAKAEGTSQIIQYPDAPSPKAYYGIAGEIVEAIEPHTEADPVALLAQSLITFGSMIGREAHFRVESDLHRMNMFVGLVGTTSKGRKGTSLNRVRYAFEGIDDVWMRERNYAGLSSGEGLIWAVRDPIEKMTSIKEKGRVVGREPVIEDYGIEDKRLMVIEPEFESVLRVLSREGNTLSSIMRQAWDTGDLRTMTKNSPAKATGSHISIIGHITRDGLRHYLNRIEIANGFANRFIWLCVKRSKVLPEGGKLRDEDIYPLRKALQERVEFSRNVQEIYRDDASRALWAEIYPELSEGKLGLLGTVLSRAESQVTRLSSLYTLLDLSYVVRTEHLEAALALWDYSEQSARFIFGDATGNPTADTILKNLRTNPRGLTRTDIRDIFGRNKSAHEIDMALVLLVNQGRARMTMERTHGRSAERWIPV
jgi:hypothetical protein